MTTEKISASPAAPASTTSGATPAQAPRRGRHVPNAGSAEAALSDAQSESASGVTESFANE